MKPGITFIYQKVCPFAQRVWITLEEKKVPYTPLQVSLDNKTPYFIETYKKAFGHDPTSQGKVPILIDGDKIMAESDLITWYVAQKFNTGTQIIPKDDYDRLRMRWFAQTHGKFTSCFYGFKGYQFKSEEDQQKHLNNTHKCLQDLEKSLALPYALGKDFTLADVLIFPWFERACVFEKFYNLKLLERYGKIQNWFNNIAQRDSLKVTRQSNEAYVNNYKKYFG